MKLVSNTGTQRVIDLIRPWLAPGHRLDMVTPSFSLFAFAELQKELTRLAGARVVLPKDNADLALLGTDDVLRIMCPASDSDGYVREKPLHTAYRR